MSDLRWCFLDWLTCLLEDESSCQGPAEEWMELTRCRSGWVSWRLLSDAELGLEIVNDD